MFELFKLSKLHCNSSGQVTVNSFFQRVHQIRYISLPEDGSRTGSRNV